MSSDQKPLVLPSLRFLTGPLSNSTFEITNPITTLGRDKSNDIILSDQNVSRFHARIVYSEGLWNIENLSKTSSIKVDQHPVSQAVLSKDSLVELGSAVSFLFSFPFLVNEQSKSTEKKGPHLNTEEASYTALGIASLEVMDNTTGVKKIYPLVKEQITIGRDVHNDIIIDNESVAPEHLQIVREGKQWLLCSTQSVQTGSASGLHYQGRMIQGTKAFRKPLTRGDVYRIGDEYGNLVTLAYKDGSSNLQQAPMKIQPIRLNAPEVSIGRVAGNDVVLNHPQVSAHHARLVRDGEGYRLLDLHSTNHSYVNGLQVSSRLLHSHDEIRIGPFRFLYNDTELTQFDESEGIRIDALHLKKLGSNQIVLLQDISLSIPARSFVALVGGSGAGKTTLLDALSGFRPAQEGSVYYNGQDYYHNIASFNSQIGYVPQDDIIHRDLTVERVLYYAAKLRLPQDFTEVQIEQRIDEVLDDVEMKHRRQLLVNQLSGGQRKRVSIALELLAKPSLFFLDEPTSGLDPGLDRKMMILLRRLADRGHTIVLVTHATNNINVCDYVCFLAPGGHLAYFGPPEEAKAYFKQPDFAEIYSVLEPTDDARSIPAQAGERFKQSLQHQKYIDAALNQIASTSPQPLHEQQGRIETSQRGTGWRQFLLLSQRYLELLRNDRGNLAILLLQAPIMGLLLLLFIKGAGANGFSTNMVLECPATATIIAARGYPDVPTPDNPIVSISCQRVKDFLLNTPSGEAYAHLHGGTIQALQDFLVPGAGFAQTVVFLMAFSAIMFGCINSIREFVKEAPIFRRERTVNLGVVPYMFSKILVLGVLCLLQSLVLVTCTSVFDPFQHSVFLPPFLEIYITVALVSLAGLMLGLLISALSTNGDRAMSFIPLLLLPQVVFAGTIFPITNWFLQIAGLFFPIRWAMAALGSSVGLHSDKLNGDKLIGNIYTFRSTLFSTYSQTEAIQYLLLMWLALLLMILVFGIGVGFCLKRKNRKVV